MRCAVVMPSDKPRGVNQFKLRFGDQDPRSSWHDVQLDCAFDEKEPVRWGDVVHCVMLGTDNTDTGVREHSLVLRAVEGRQGVYRRAGVTDHPPLLFAGAPVVVVTII